MELIKILIKYGADVDTSDGLGMTPLFRATAKSANLEIATYFIEEANASVNITNKYGSTALHGCAYIGNIGIAVPTTLQLF